MSFWYILGNQNAQLFKKKFSLLFRINLFSAKKKMLIM